MRQLSNLGLYTLLTTIAGLFFGLSSLSAQLPKPKYNVIDIGPLGGNTGSSGSIMGFNNKGEIVGQLLTIDEESLHESYRGFIYSDGQLRSFALSSEFTEISDINDKGDAVGVYLDSEGVHRTFVTSSLGIIRELGISTYYNRIDQNGNIYGKKMFYEEGSTYSGHLISHDNLLTTEYGPETASVSGGFRANESGIIVGQLTSPGQPGFIFTDGDLVDVTPLRPVDINDFGQVVGHFRQRLPNGTFADAGFIHNISTQTRINLGFAVLPHSVNDSGEIITAEGNFSPGLFYNGQKKSIDTLITPDSRVTYDAHSLAYASQINDLGQIVLHGNVRNPDGSLETHGFLLTQNVPDLPFNLLSLSYEDWGLVHHENLLENSGVVTAGAGSWIKFNSNLANGGALIANSGGGLLISGTLTNQVFPSTGEIRADENGQIIVTGRTELRGEGLVTLAGGRIETPSSLIGVFSPDDNQIVNVDNTIRGHGIIGDGDLVITNQSKIEAGSFDTLTIQPNLHARGVSSSSGEIKAHNGGYIVILDSGRPFQNLGGKVSAIGGGSSSSPYSENPGVSILPSLIEIEGSMKGGQMTAEDGGVLLVSQNLGHEILTDVHVQLSGSNSIVAFRGQGRIENVQLSGDNFPGQEAVMLGSLQTFASLGFDNITVVFPKGYTSIITGDVVGQGNMTIGGNVLSAVAPFASPTDTNVAMLISGEVRLKGFSTNELVNGVFIDGVPGRINELINESVITGSGIIGKGANQLLPDEGHLKFTNTTTGEIQVRTGDELTIVSETFLNTGDIQIQPGGRLNIAGDLKNTLGGVIFTITGATRGSGYGFLDIAGDLKLDSVEANFYGGYIPEVGTAFEVAKYRTNSSLFVLPFTNQISEGAVIDTVFVGNSLFLTVKERGSGTDAPIRDVAPGEALRIAQGESFAGISSASAMNHRFILRATLLDGTASAVKDVQINFTEAGEFTIANGGPLVSDRVGLQGIDGETFVLQLDYDEALLPSGQSERDLFLAWFDGESWVNAVLGNSDNGEQQHRFLGSYNPEMHFSLGNYGLDTLNNRVWAVIDHNSEFGAALPVIVPEPDCFILCLVGLLCLFMFHRGNRPRSLRLQVDLLANRPV